MRYAFAAAVASLAVHLEYRGSAQQEQRGGQSEKEAAAQQPQDDLSRVFFGETELTGNRPAIAVEENRHGEGDDRNDQEFAIGSEALQYAPLSLVRESMAGGRTSQACELQGPAPGTGSVDEIAR